MPNLRQPYELIKAQIQTQCPDITFVSMWNNQVKNLLSNAPMQWPFSVPAAFIEFTNPNKILQLGNGVQIFEPLYVKIHVVNTFYNATNGIDVMEEDPGQFDLLEEIYTALQDFTPEGCVSFFRIDEGADYDHTNLEHYWTTFQTNYVDFAMNRPVGGVLWTETSPPHELIIIEPPFGQGIMVQTTPTDNGPFGPLLWVFDDLVGYWLVDVE